MAPCCCNLPRTAALATLRLHPHHSALWLHAAVLHKPRDRARTAKAGLRLFLGGDNCDEYGCLLAGQLQCSCAVDDSSVMRETNAAAAALERSETKQQNAKDLLQIQRSRNLTCELPRGLGEVQLLNLYCIDLSQSQSCKD